MHAIALGRDRRSSARSATRHDRYDAKAIRLAIAGACIFLLYVQPAGAGFEEAAKAYENADVEKMFAILEPMAANGDARAQGLLGVIFYSAIFVKEDIELAKRYFERAAKKSDAEAQYNLGFMYREGAAGDLDPRKATYWFRKSAEQGHPQAQFYLGLSYATGLGVEKNFAKALFWLEKAARQDHKLAESFLARLPLSIGGSKDLTLTEQAQIVQRLEELRNDALAPVQLSLGQVYAEGLGAVVPDRIEGLKWYILASFQGLPPADKVLKKLLEGMSPVDIEIAKKRAVKWLVAASKKRDTYIGKAARWCIEERPNSLDCLKRANFDHGSCLAPFYPGLFRNFSDSKTYSVCRAKRFEDGGKVTAYDQRRVLQGQ